MTYETVIGLECHVELSTKTKMFCSCANEFGAEPNTLVCPICLGHPGTLPVPNERAIEHTITIGLALGSEIAPSSLFHRKNYFYPDMPKNYQISQYDLPLCVGGALEVEVDGETRRVGITRVHLEEDTGKTTHAGTTGRIAGADYALEDYNRAGVPLVEVVSEPDLRSPVEARAYLVALRGMLRSLGVSDVKMEEGSLRCDANISVRPEGYEELGTKVEIKNMNSIRSVERALAFEAERQRAALEAGETLVQETRHWDEDQGATSSMRSKEEAFDYRYFPDPDLSPLEPEAERVERLRSELPELPAARRARLGEEIGLEKPELVEFFGESAEWTRVLEHAWREISGVGANTLGSFIYQNTRTNASVDDVLARLDVVIEVAEMIRDKTISVSRAKEVDEEAWRSGKPPRQIVEERGLAQISDEGALGAIVDEVIAENPDPVEQFRGGKEGAIGFLVGQVMQRSKGAANPQEAQRLLRERLAR